jgi:hypothetical protein
MEEIVEKLENFAKKIDLSFLYYTENIEEFYLEYEKIISEINEIGEMDDNEILFADYLKNCIGDYIMYEKVINYFRDKLKIKQNGKHRN